MTLDELMAHGAVDVADAEKPTKGLTLDELKAKGAVDSPSVPTPKVGAVESFSRGLSSFIPGGKQAEAAFNTLPLVGTGKSYHENLADVNARGATAAEQHPDASNLGKGTGLAASMLVPGGVATQAALGAANAASDANARGESALDTAGAAATGGALQGLAGPIAGKAVQGAMNVGAKVVTSPAVAKAVAHVALDSIPHVAAAALHGGGVGHSIATAADFAIESMHLPQKLAGTMGDLVARAKVEKWPTSKLAAAIVKLSRGAGQAAGTEVASDR